MRSKIWKLQKPILIEHLPVLEVMAYTKDRNDTAFIPMTEEDVSELFGDEYKIYVKAIIKDGILHVKKIVGEQDW